MKKKMIPVLSAVVGYLGVLLVSNLSAQNNLRPEPLNEQYHGSAAKVSAAIVGSKTNSFKAEVLTAKEGAGVLVLTVLPKIMLSQSIPEEGRIFVPVVKVFPVQACSSCAKNAPLSVRTLQPVMPLSEQAFPNLVLFRGEGFLKPMQYPIPYKSLVKGERYQVVYELYEISPEVHFNPDGSTNSVALPDGRHRTLAFSTAQWLEVTP